MQNPATVVPLLATSLPGQVDFFLSYVMILSLSGATWELWRPLALVVRLLVLRFFTSTKRERRNANGPYVANLHVFMALHLIVFIVVVGESVSRASIWRLHVNHIKNVSAQYIRR